jgi:predicted TIM-barrel fold metal-dependent hydrolase
MDHPRYQGPVIDAHCHIDGAHRHVATAALAAAGVDSCLNLWNLEWPPPSFERWSSEFEGPTPVRMALGHAPDLSGIGAVAAERVEASIRAAARAGAAVLKVWKNLGLTLYDERNIRVTVDDPRLDVVWRTAGEVGLPVLIHVADPVAFFAPLDDRNERLAELRAHPDWWFGGPGMPAFLELIGQLDRVIGRHPDTIFIGAHMGCYAEDLRAVGEMLERHANYLIDTSARIAEIGRQDRVEVRDFFIRHADRILFGSDFSRTRNLMQPETRAPADEHRYFARQWRYFETAERGLEHPIPVQGAWRVDGIDLPDEVLAKIYAHNAARVMPALCASPGPDGGNSGGA